MVKSELGKLSGRKIMPINAAPTWVSPGAWPRASSKIRAPARRPTSSPNSTWAVACAAVSNARASQARGTTRSGFVSTRRLIPKRTKIASMFTPCSSNVPGMSAAAPSRSKFRRLTEGRWDTLVARFPPAQIHGPTMEEPVGIFQRETGANLCATPTQLLCSSGIKTAVSSGSNFVALCWRSPGFAPRWTNRHTTNAAQSS